MIDPKELRIRNLIDRNGLMEVIGVMKNKIYIYDHYNRIAWTHGFDPEGFKPIPLTPEWLERLGLIRQRDRKMWIKGKCAIVWYDGDRFNPAGYYLAFKDMGNVLYHTQCKVDYVHQVQNGFAVAGEELKDKP